MENKDLLRYKKDQTYVVFDTETEGLNLLYSRPWQVAYGVYRNGKLIEESDRLVYWDNLDIPDIVQKLTGFSQKRYDNEAEPPEDVWKNFEKVIMNEDHILVGQNLLGFDIHMITIWRRLMGLEPNHDYLTRILDTRALAIAWKKEITDNVPTDPEERLAWQFRMINGQRNNRKIKVSQNQLLKDFGIEFEEAKLHDAKYDNFCCKQVFDKLLWEVAV
mgnify:FL=1|tara:strand:- start:37950 stop:38603 length:654 start_codon:yes stop_codon:yes gene_type:complete